MPLSLGDERRGQKRSCLGNISRVRRPECVDAPVRYVKHDKCNRKRIPGDSIGDASLFTTWCKEPKAFVEYFFCVKNDLQ